MQPEPTILLGDFRPYIPPEVEKALSARRAHILNAFANQEAQPTPALLRELAEINIQLGEA